MSEELILLKKSEIEERLRIYEDSNFTFHEESHVYRYSGVKYDSVTTFLKIFKVPFDREYWSKRKAEERGVDVSVILNEWETKGDVSRNLGTIVHKFIEDFWSGKNPEIPDDNDVKDRVMKFMDVYNKRLHKLTPLKSELKIFSRKWRLAGTIDQPLLIWDSLTEKVHLIIGDWKTNGEFKDDNHPKGRFKKLLRPFNNLYENDHNEYSIQISLYRLILEEIGIETESGFLLHLGPEDTKIYPAKDLREPLRAYLNQNRTEFDIFKID
jgi:hypothetical protein